MSFFDDEDDEPPPNPRPASSRPRPSARRRPTAAPTHKQQVQTRRIVAAVALVVVIILIIVLVGSCDSSANRSSLQGYAGNVYTIIGKSDSDGKSLFTDLASGQSQSTLQTDLDGLAADANTYLQQAERLSVPGAMTRAQTYVVLTLRERYDGIHIIASSLQTALTSSTGADGVREIARGTAYLYASDVTYKGYAAPAIASGLHGASLSTSSLINPGQIVSDLGWLQQQFIATKIGAVLPSKDVNKVVPGGLYGHSLNYVSVNGTELVSGTTNTVSASSAPTFSLNITNGGNYNEYDVGCKVAIKGVSDTGTTTLPETTAGQTTTCSVTLPKRPPSGPYQVTATVEKVPGEKNLSNNSLTYTVDFTG